MNDEMEDEDPDLKAPGPLGAYLQLCQSKLGRLYQHADDEALRYQNVRIFSSGWS